MSKMKRAKSIGLKIADRISDATMNFIEEHDPDLHYDLVQARRKRRKKQ